MRIAILGSGGVGGLVAGALTRAGEDVLVIARASTASLIASEGISVDSERLGSFTARPDTATTLREPGVVLIVATKATGLDAALLRIREPPALVVPLLNGIEHLGLLRTRFGADRVAAGVIRVESDCPAPGHIVQSSPTIRIDLAWEGARAHPLLVDVAQRLDAAGLPTAIGASEAQVMWSKLVRLNALALTTSASGRTLGEIRADPRWRSALGRAVAETAAVALAQGAELDPADTMSELEAAHAGLRSSMHRDLQAGRAPELDAIAGAVLRGARRHGIPCPSVTYLTRRVAQRAAMSAPRVD